MAEEPHEQSTLNVRAVLIGAAAIAAGVLLSLLAARGLLKGFGEPPPPVTGQPFEHVAGPPLEITPGEDLERFRAEERKKLTGYHLIDDKDGIARIPIERAMALLAEEHGDGAQR